MGDVVQRATQPALAAVKLAWWRERLEELDQGKVPAEPRLQAAARELLPRGISGAELAELEAGWAALLQEWPNVDEVVQRGIVLFSLGARLLSSDASDSLIISAMLYVGGGLSRRQLVPKQGLLTITESPRIPRKFRPLTTVAALAKRDLHPRDLRGVEPEGTPARAWTVIRHRLTGRL